MIAIAVECQPDEYVRLHARWRLDRNVSLFNLCAGNVGPRVSVIYNADGASTMIHDNAVGHSGERRRYLHSDRKGTPVIMMPLDQLVWGGALPAEAGQVRSAPSDTYVQALVPPRLDYLPHPICAVKVDIQGFERAALEGLRVTLQRYKPVVYYEFDHRFHANAIATGGGVTQYLQRFGYVCVPNDQLSVESSTKASHHTWPCALGYCDVLCSAQFSTERELLRWMLPRWKNFRGPPKNTTMAKRMQVHNPWLERKMTSEEAAVLASHASGGVPAAAGEGSASPSAAPTR